MNQYNILIIITVTIVFVLIITLLFSKSNLNKSFVHTNGKSMKYNIYKIHTDESTKQLPSSQILEWTFKSYNASDEMYKYTRDVQYSVGVNNTIWAIKKHYNKINWEYYFYGLSKDSNTDLSKLYTYNPKLSLEEYFKNIHKKYFPLESLNIMELNKYKDKLIIFSVDIHPKFFNDKKIGNIDIYLNQSVSNVIELPYICNCYSFSDNDEIKIKGVDYVYNIREPAQKNIMMTRLKLLFNNNTDILISNWEKIDHLTLINKIYSNSISINYFGFDIDTFILFIKKHKYAKDFVHKIENNKERLKHLSFEFSEDYDKNTLEITKTSIYGSF